MTTEHKDGLAVAAEKTTVACIGFCAPVATSAVCMTYTDMLLEHAVSINIRDGEIVGTPWGPEIPDGRYVWVSELEGKAQ